MIQDAFVSGYICFKDGTYTPIIKTDCLNTPRPLYLTTKGVFGIMTRGDDREHIFVEYTTDGPDIIGFICRSDIDYFHVIVNRVIVE